MEEKLTQRELEIVQWVAEGFNNREIAEKLYLSRHTVKSHLQNAYQKLQIDNRVKLAFWFQAAKNSQ